MHDGKVCRTFSAIQSNSFPFLEAMYDVHWVLLTTNWLQRMPSCNQNIFSVIDIIFKKFGYNKYRLQRNYFYKCTVPSVHSGAGLLMILLPLCIKFYKFAYQLAVCPKLVACVLQPDRDIFALNY